MHTNDCAAVGGQECSPAFYGEWNQPPRAYVEAATADLGEAAPWCQLVERAFAIRDDEDT